VSGRGALLDTQWPVIAILWMHSFLSVWSLSSPDENRDVSKRPVSWVRSLLVRFGILSVWSLSTLKGTGSPDENRDVSKRQVWEPEYSGRDFLWFPLSEGVIHLPIVCYCEVKNTSQWLNEQWLWLFKQYDYIEIDDYIVMPDHWRYNIENDISKKRSKFFLFDRRCENIPFFYI
jgi:hypothetical protein